MRGTSLVIGLIAFLFTACDSQNKFYNPGAVRAEPSSGPNLRAIRNESVQLSIVNQATAAEAIEVVFLLDNSYSMSDDLAKLRESLGALTVRLAATELNYRFRFLNLSSLKTFSTMSFGQETGAGILLSNLSFEGTSPFTTPVFDRGSEAATVTQTLETVSNIDNTLQFEHGIALASSFLNWNNYSPDEISRRLQGKSTHFVMVSNEDNSLGWQRNDGMPLYTYATDRYRGVATKLGTCQARGFSPETEKLTRQILRTDTHYVKNAFAGSAGQAGAIGRDIASYRCELGTNEGFWWSADISRSHQLCEVPSAWECPIAVDGITEWVGSSSLASNECRAKAGATKSFRPVTNAIHPAITSCRAINQCEVATSSVFQVQRDPVSKMITQIEKKAIPAGFTQVTVPSVLATIADTCPGELQAKLPEGVITSTARSDVMKVAFDYFAAPNMTEDDIKKVLAAKHKTSLTLIEFSEQPSEKRRQAFAATPAGFLDLASRLHPHAGEVVWHSLISLGNRCGAATVGGEFSEGKTYRELSDATGGIVKDICSPDFDPFMEALAKSIVYGAKRTYDLSMGPGAKFMSVENMTQKRRLIPGEDYELINSQLVLSPQSRVSVGDAVVINYEPAE